MARGSAPHYAPADPSLPPPWKTPSVDAATPGYIHYCNTQTNATPYKKLLPPSVPPLPPDFREFPMDYVGKTLHFVYYAGKLSQQEDLKPDLLARVNYEAKALLKNLPNGQIL